MLWSTENSFIASAGLCGREQTPSHGRAKGVLSCCSNGLSLQHHGRDLGTGRGQAQSSECPRAQLLCTLSKAQPVPGAGSARLSEGRAASPGSRKGWELPWHLLHPEPWTQGAGCQAFQQALHLSIPSATWISAYSNNTKFKTTTNKPSAKSTELDNSCSFNEISWLQPLPRQMSNLLSDLEKQYSIASAPLGTASCAFFTATFLYVCHKKEGRSRRSRRQGQQQGKVLVRGRKTARGGCTFIRFIKLFHSACKETYPRHPKQSPPRQPPNYGGDLPEIKEQRNQTIFQLSTGRLNYTAQPKSWAELSKQKDALS